MRTARAAPLCLSGRGAHGLLQLHRRLLQSHPAALRPGVSLAHLLRTGDANRPTVRHPLNRPPKRGNFRPRRHRRFGSEPGRSEAGAGGRPAGDCRRAGQGPRRAATGVPVLRGRLPREGLSPARDRHAVRPSRGPVAPLLLCWLRHDRDRRGVAAVRPLDSGVGSAAGAALRSADLPDGSRPARADVPGGRGPGPGDIAPSYLPDRQDPAMTSAAEAPVSVDAEAIIVTLDSTFIRSCEVGQRHLEVRIGNVETESGGRQVFGAVAKANTDIGALIRRALDTIGRTGDTALTAFTDGCAGLRRILADAGVTAPPMLDWFHIAMRLQHLKQVAGVLSDEDPARGEAKAMIITEVERLRWRIWNGKAKDAQISIDRIHALLPSVESEPARKLRRALDAVDRYLRSQSAHLVDYAERHRAGQRVGTALTEGTANFLVNRRMAQAQQMRWTRRGADRLLQVRCALYNGTLGTGFGQKFLPANDPHPPMAVAA